MTLNSNHVGNLKDYFDPYYDTREEAQDKLALKSDVLHRHEDDLSRIEARTMFIYYAPVFHVHMVDEVLEIKDELANYSDVDHTHPEFYLMVEVDAQWAALRALLESKIGLRAVMVEELPEEAQEGTVYIITKEETQEGNVYDEYIFYDGQWEIIDTGLEPLRVLDEYATVTMVAEAILTIAKNNHTHSEYITIEEFDKAIFEKANNTLASEESMGLMSKEDYSKLESVEEFANNTPVDEALSEESCNCVENRAIAEAYNTLEGKVQAALDSLDELEAELEAIEIV